MGLISEKTETCYVEPGLQVIFQNLLGMMSGKNKIPLDI